MIALLHRKYNEEKTCVVGDIEFLFSFDGIGIEEKHKNYKP
jgi:hypothetical protein